MWIRDGDRALFRISKGLHRACQFVLDQHQTKIFEINVSVISKDEVLWLLIGTKGRPTKKEFFSGQLFVVWRLVQVPCGSPEGGQDPHTKPTGTLNKKGLTCALRMADFQFNQKICKRFTLGKQKRGEEMERWKKS